MSRPLRILIWNIHGAYLNTLVHMPHEWILPVRPGGGDGYGGIGPGQLTQQHARNVPAEDVRSLDLDLVIFQTPTNWEEDRYTILSEEQRGLPAIYLQHNVPKPHAVDSRHPVDDPTTLLVHVTQYNRLMWDNNGTPTAVIEHSVVIDPTARYDGGLERGITVVNSLPKRGRSLGLDLFLEARRHVPLDIAGMENEELDPIGDVPYPDLHSAVARYRFLYSPIRYTSLPLAVIEAFHIGMPVLALATTDLPSVIENGVHGYVSCDPGALIARAKEFLADPAEARRLGANARRLADERYGFARFSADWNAAFRRAMALRGREA